LLGVLEVLYHLRRAGHRWNHEAAHRVYCAFRLNIPPRSKGCVPVCLRHPLSAPTRLNETWALDFMADALYDGRPSRALTVIDEGNREALAVEIGTSIHSGRVIRVLDELVRLFGCPARVRVDNSPKLATETFVEWCAAQRTGLGYIQPGKLDQNAFIERFNLAFREEVLDAYLFGSVEDVRAIISPPVQASLKIRLYCSSNALRYSSIRGLIRYPISIVFFSS